MEIIKASAKHKEVVLKLLDEFRTACVSIIEPGKNYVSTSARDNGGELFDEVIFSKNSAIFLAIETKEYVGIVTVHKIPQIRKGKYCAEIEEMFVKDCFQGKGVAKLLIESVIDWVKSEGIGTLRLESSNELKRAHAFYEKVGFKNYGQAYQLKIE